jgi:restriction endonuclease S subunit
MLNNMNSVIKYTRLNDKCNMIQGRSLKINNLTYGSYLVVNSYVNILKEKYSEYNTDENEILMFNYGNDIGYLNKFNEKIFITDKCEKIIAKDINKDFLWYYLKINQYIISNTYQKGRLIKHLDKSKLLEEFMIPDVSFDHQQEIVNFLDGVYQDENINQTINCFKDKPIFNLLIDKNYESYKDIIFLQYRISYINLELDNMKKNKNILVRSIFNKYKNISDNIKLSDIVNIITCKNLLKPDENYIMNYEQSYEYNDEIIIITCAGIVGTINLLSDKYCSTDLIFALTLKENNIISKYLYYYLKFNEVDIKNLANKNTVPNLSIDILLNFIIKVPSIEIQKEIINIINNILNYESYYNKYSKILKIELDNIIDIINNMCISSL